MAVDEDFAARVRRAAGAGLTERRMFGGVALMRNGNMAVVIRGRGGLMVRVDPDDADPWLVEPGAEVTEMRGRPMRGWITIAESGCAKDADIRRWVRRGLTFAATLPAK